MKRRILQFYKYLEGKIVLHLARFFIEIQCEQFVHAVCECIINSKVSSLIFILMFKETNFILTFIRGESFFFFFLGYKANKKKKDNRKKELTPQKERS